MLKKLFFILFIFILAFGSGSISGGFNTGKSNHDSAWVNDQTELLGGNVDINVDGKTTITGAVIAAVDKNGLDNGNLNLATNELEYKDIKDFNTSSESGFGFSSNVGISTDKGKTNLHPSGSTTISMKDTGTESEQTTHATIGGGSITVGGRKLDDNDPALAGLNRDTDKSQEITRDEITGALDGSVTIDNRLLTSKGRAQIADQHKNLAKNTVVAGTGAVGTVVETAASVYDTVTTEDASLSDTWSAYQKAKVYGITGASNDVVQDLRARQANGEILSPSDLKLLSELTRGKENANNVYSDEYIPEHGFFDPKSDTGYINVAKIGTDQQEFFLTDAEEAAHRFTDNETIASSAADREMGYYNAVSWATGGNGISTSPYDPNAQQSWNDSYNIANNSLLYNNSYNASLVDDADKLYRTPVFRPMPNMRTGTYRSTQSYNIGSSRIGSGPVNFEELTFEQQFAIRANDVAIRDAKAKGLEPETFMTAQGSPTPPLSFRPANRSAEDSGSTAPNFVVRPDGQIIPVPSKSSYTPKVQRQINKNSDLFHSFPSSVDTLAPTGITTPFTGNDGRPYIKIQLPGSINNTQGNYEYIFNPRENNFNHRQFEPITK